jgi:hypothetical protein
MPNWCNNTITITGPKDKIKAIWDKANEEDGGLLSAMVPMPAETFTGNLGEKERKECEAKGIPNWYDWSVSNWGTKWDVSTEGLELVEDGDDAQITGYFDSAWAPPIPAYDTFLEANEDCSITAAYEEGGMDFCGVYEDGDDEYMEDIQTEVMDVLTGYKTLEETSPLFQRMNEEFELIENRSYLYELDDINEARKARGMEPLSEDEFQAMEA